MIRVSHGWAAAGGGRAVRLEARVGAQPAPGAAHEAGQLVHCTGTQHTCERNQRGTA